MDSRSIAKISLAASNVLVEDYRQAAILGGMVRSLIDNGRFDRDHALLTASSFIATGVELDPQLFTDRRAASFAELARVVELWKAEYEPPHPAQRAA